MIQWLNMWKKIQSWKLHGPKDGKTLMTTLALMMKSLVVSKACISLSHAVPTVANKKLVGPTDG
jgi:hypothetical protein